MSGTATISQNAAQVSGPTAGSPPPSVTDQGACVAQFYYAKLRCHYRQKTRCNRGIDTVFDLRRHSMSMHVPPSPCMLEESVSRCNRQALPDLLTERPDSVDNAAPIVTFCHMIIDQFSQPAQ